MRCIFSSFVTKRKETASGKMSCLFDVGNFCVLSIYFIVADYVSTTSKVTFIIMRQQTQNDFVSFCGSKIFWQSMGRGREVCQNHTIKNLNEKKTKWTRDLTPNKFPGHSEIKRKTS